MKKTFLALCACLLTNAVAIAQELPTLAVFPPLGADLLRAVPDGDKMDVQELTRQIEEGIRATRRFTVFERSAQILTKSVLAEQEFAQGGKALGDAAELGKLNNVQLIVQPQITRASLNVRRSAMDESPGKFRYAVTGSLSVSVKVLNTTSAQIGYQKTVAAELASGNRAASNLNGATDSGAAATVGFTALSKDIANKATNAIVNSLFPLLVVQAQGGDIFINRGEGGGVNVGEAYQIFSTGEALIDPVTKEILGDAEELLGEVVISRVTPKFSVAREKTPLRGKVKTGDVLRPLP